MVVSEGKDPRGTLEATTATLNRHDAVSGKLGGELRAAARVGSGGSDHKGGRAVMC